MKKKNYRVAVVGATGAVGQEMVRLLETRRFPVESLRLFASARSLGKSLTFQGRALLVENLEDSDIRGLDLALFSAGGAVSKAKAPAFSGAGIFVVDNSSAWRMSPEVPLVVPEVNAHALSRDKKIIANPNCSTIQMVVVLKPLHDAVGLTRVVVSTYQSTSGAGARAMWELGEATRAWAQGQEFSPKVFPHSMAFNLLPADERRWALQPNGYSLEEMKMVHETRKILGLPHLAISTTCVRVPTFRGHAEVIWIETEKKLSAQEARAILSRAPGVQVMDDPQHDIYPTPRQAEGHIETFVGRIREDISCERGLVLWVVSDNLLKGAAWNAVQIAETLLARDLL